jgi:heme-degrading monooxygenase HmoA
MIVELRRYLPVRDRERDLDHRFRTSTLDLFARRGFKVTDFWVTEGATEIVYLVEWDSVEQMTEAWEAFRTDPEWLAIKRATEADGPITASIISTVLHRPDYFQPARL